MPTSLESGCCRSCSPIDPLGVELQRLPPMDALVFARSVLLAGLPPAEQERLAARMRRQAYRRGEVVVRQGDPGLSLHVLLEGRLKVVVAAQSGDELLLALLGPGDVFGEVALLDGGPRSATVVALEPSRTASLTREDFLDLLSQRAAVRDGVLVALAGMIRRETDELADFVGLGVTGRLAKRLLALAQAHGQQVGGTIELVLPLTQEELADMVGSTRASINQILGSFEDRGAISRRGHRLVILRPELLRRLAGE
jgi:CRP/FNR family cyclic AMP-dependent transcriptional regulator